MKLFDAARPEASPGTKALLLEGSAVPHISVLPREDGTYDLSVHLRNYDANERSYSFHTTWIKDPTYFFDLYRNDPEAALLLVFGWTAKQPPTVRARAAVARPPLNNPMMDLL